MKTYSTAANARRAAKSQLTNTQGEKPVEGVDFQIEGDKEAGFSWYRIQIAQPAAPALEEPAPKTYPVEEAPKRRQSDKLDAPISDYHSCPKCGSEELWAGMVDKHGVLDDNSADDVGGCHACGWETKGNHKARRSGAVAAVWEICEANKELRRKDVIALCVAQGLNYYTSRTQYQEWFRATKNSQPK